MKNALVLGQGTSAAPGALVEDPFGICALLLVVLAVIFAVERHAAGRALFGIVPKLVFCYFVPTLLTTFGVIPQESPLYDWVKTFLLPVSLVLLILALDVPGIVRLGPKAVIMFLAGTLGVVIGAPIAMLVMRGWLPDDAWRGMAALSGSWIGGGANMVAIGEAAECSSELFGLMVIVDVFVANVWMGVLLWMAGRHERIDARTGADTSAIRDLQARIAAYEAKHARPATLNDLLVMLAIAFGGAWLALEAGRRLAPLWTDEHGGAVISATVWKFILVTALAMGLSFTRVRRLEGAGASRVGSTMLYLLVATIGAHASFTQLGEAPALVIAGAIWMLVHVGVLLLVAKLIRAPIFFVAVGSQANIGGAASAPIVASAFHPSLAPVGVLLAVGGYVLGTYAGLLTMVLLRATSGAG